LSQLLKIPQILVQLGLQFQVQILPGKEAPQRPLDLMRFQLLITVDSDLLLLFFDLLHHLFLVILLPLKAGKHEIIYSLSFHVSELLLLLLL
jgi:hypothetical protein